MHKTHELLTDGTRGADDTDNVVCFVHDDISLGKD